MDKQVAGEVKMRFAVIDLDTRNNILFLGVGPELGVQMGPLRPYVKGCRGCWLFCDHLRTQWRR